MQHGYSVFSIEHGIARKETIRVAIIDLRGTNNE